MRTVGVALLIGFGFLTPFTVQLDPYGCRVPARRGEAPRLRAIRCAEEFIARNGYTAHPPTVDSADFAWESLTFGTTPLGTTVRAQLEMRRNTLESQAFGVCDDAHASPGFTVIFLYRSDSTKTPPINARAVTMNPEFSGLLVEHQDFDPRYVLQHKDGCFATTSPR